MASDKKKNTTDRAADTQKNPEALSDQNTVANRPPGDAKYEDIHFVDSSKPVWNYSLFIRLSFL